MIDHTALKAGGFGRLPAKVPCRECPLARASTPRALGGYTAQQYLDVAHGIADLACHLSKGFDARNAAAQRSCTGLAMYRANVGVTHLARNSKAAVEHVGRNTDLVFASPAEFMQHHDPSAKPYRIFADGRDCGVFWAIDGYDAAEQAIARLGSKAAQLARITGHLVTDRQGEM